MVDIDVQELQGEDLEIESKKQVSRKD